MSALQDAVFVHFQGTHELQVLRFLAEFVKNERAVKRWWRLMRTGVLH